MKILGNYQVQQQACPLDPTPMTPVLRSFRNEAEEVKDAVHKRKEPGKGMRLAAREPTPEEVEVHAMQVRSQGALFSGGEQKIVTMVADAFFVDGTPFLLTMSQQIKFITTKDVPPVRTSKSLSKHLD
jgi:hypothetical protein